METETEEETEEPLNTLEDFIRAHGLVDWPVTCEEHGETSAEFFPFANSEKIYEHLKAQVPFPSPITRRLLENFEELCARVKGHESKLSLVKSKAPVEKAVGKWECMSGGNPD